jgi:hypothetical protein
VYWYANLEKMWPPGYIQGNPWNVMQVFEKMSGIVGDKLPRVVPGHDMEVFKRNVSWTAGLNPVAELHLAAGEKSRRPK